MIEQNKNAVSDLPTAFSIYNLFIIPFSFPLIAEANSGVPRFLKRVQIIGNSWFRFNLRAPFLLLIGEVSKKQVRRAMLIG